jgi:hypothetical protein
LWAGRGLSRGRIGSEVGPGGGLGDAMPRLGEDVRVGHGLAWESVIDEQEIRCGRARKRLFFAL